MFTLDDLSRLTQEGWAIFPCHSIQDGACTCGNPVCDKPGKHPRTINGVKGATQDPVIIRRWFTSWPDANWAGATGAPSGRLVIDLDTNSVDGPANMARWIEENHVPKFPTRVIQTGGGGWHYVYRMPPTGERIRNRVNMLPGVDVRADGGYVLLPGSNHVSGGTYAVAQDAPLTHVPDEVLRLIHSKVKVGESGDTPIAGLSVDAFISGIEQGGRDDTIFLMACRLRRLLNDNREAITLLCLEAGRNSTPPFPDDETLRKVDQAFAQDHSDIVNLDALPFVAANGQMPEWLEEQPSEFIEAVERSVMAANVREASQRIVRAQRAARHAVNRSMDGLQFVESEDLLKAPLWGEGNRLMWVDGEGLLIASDQGLGKTLTAQQLVKGRLGLGPGRLLGLPITPLEEDKLIVYLAMDRPAQAARSMARLFLTDEERKVAQRRMRVWRGPLPVDITSSPDELANFLEGEFGPNVGDLIGDSVKDYTPGITKDEVGSALNVAWQEVLARGINVVNLHHERKTGGDESRGNREPSLDNIYGSVWITSGQGSVLHIKGKQGENIVTYTQLKFPLEPVPALMAMHDQEHARTDVLDANVTGAAIDDKYARILIAVQSLNAAGTEATVAMIVEATNISTTTVQRHIRKLLDDGDLVLAREFEQGKAGASATYKIKESS